MESRFHYRFLHRNHDSIVNHNPKKKIYLCVARRKEVEKGRIGFTKNERREAKGWVRWLGWGGGGKREKEEGEGLGGERKLRTW